MAAKKLEAQKLPGLTFLPEERRVYPAGTGTAIVGTTDIDGNGLAGLEKSYDAQLRGKDGHEAFVQSGGARPADAVADPARRASQRRAAGARARPRDPGRGRDASRRRRSSRPARETVTILQIDPRTGGVLSMASAPGAARDAVRRRQRRTR